MKHVLVELVMHLLGNWEVVSSKLGRTKVNFLFANFSFGHEYEGARETLAEGAAKGSWKTVHYVWFIEWQLPLTINHFRFGQINSN